MPNCEIISFVNTSELEHAFAQQICKKLCSAITEKGHASLAVSGGNTPKGLFKVLSNSNLRWSKVTITLADERWVDPSHNDNNERLVREHLLQGLAAAATFLPFKNAADTALNGQQLLAQKLSILGPIDVLILGMGGDGHTASLFPCSAELESAMDAHNILPCQSVTPTTAPYERMTLTLSWLLNSNAIFLHICGEAKRKVLEQGLKNTSTPPPIARLINQASSPVSVYYSP